MTKKDIRSIETAVADCVYYQYGIPAFVEAKCLCPGYRARGYPLSLFRGKVCLGGAVSEALRYTGKDPNSKRPMLLNPV